MKKEQAIEQIMAFRQDLAEGEKFAGRAKLLKDLDKMVRFLTVYKADDNVPTLMVKEANQKLAAIK